MSPPGTIDGTLAGLFRRRGLPFPEGRPLTGLTAVLDGAPAGRAVFYRVGDGDPSLFLARLATADPGCLVVVDRPVEGTGPRRVASAGPAFGDLAADCVDALYPPPEGRLVAGVTGTDGKTSVASFMAQMAPDPGRVLVVGTLGVLLGGRRLPEPDFGTTPPNPDLRRLLHGLRDRYGLAVLEASSHGLDQGRLRGIRLDACVWTNLGRDHLDYHGDAESYFRAKLRIRELLRPGVPILVPSTARGLLARGAPEFRETPVPAAGGDGGGDGGGGPPPFARFPFNRVNAALARAALESLHGPGSADPSRLGPVEGRAGVLERGGRTVVIDYAHTPGALAAVARGARAAFGKGVVLLFGAGGGRDRGKRALMGEAADRHADFTWITSDNPRDEDPAAIMADIRRGFSSGRHESVEDRGEAIRRAVGRLGPDQVLVVAGKGHEVHVERSGRRERFSDAEAVEAALEGGGCSERAF